MKPEDAEPKLNKIFNRIKLADDVDVRVEQKTEPPVDGDDPFVQEIPNGRYVVVITCYESSLDQTGELPEGEGV